MNQNNIKHTFEDINEDSIDIGRLFRLVLMQSKLIALTTFAVFFIAVTLFFISTKQYKVTSLLQVESFNQNILDPTDTLQMMSPNNSVDIESMITLYKSRTNILNLIKELDLNIIIDSDDDEYVDISIQTNYFEEDYSKFFYLEFDGYSYSIYDESKDFIQNFQLNEEIVIYDNLRVSINNIKLDLNDKLKVTYFNIEDLFEYYKSNIKLRSLSTQTNSFFNNDSGLIEVSLITDDIELGKRILNKSNEIFLRQRVDVETEKSRAAISFLDNNIETLTRVGDISKSQLRNFLEKNKLLDIELETQAVIDQIQVIDASLNEVDLELSNASEVYTQTNPIYINLVSRKRILENQKNLIFTQIKEMPTEQQEYIDLYTELETTQILLEELKTRRLGFSILEASTIGDIRIVDKAYKEVQVSPRILTILVLTMLGFVFAFLFSIYRGLFLLPITNPAEFLDNNLNEPMMGVIPFIDDILSNGKDDKKLLSSIESLIVNIKSLVGDDDSKKVFLITSPTPSNGKSTISTFLAASFSEINKKVLLLDCDLKRGGIAKNFDIKALNKNGFLNINDSNIDDFKVKKDFYVMPRIKGLSNSFQFILSPEFKQKIDYFRSKFDIIIIDSAPILSVADTAIIANISDANFLVVRHEISKINEIKQARENFLQLNKLIDGYIYNSYARPKGYLGYYEYYGDYAYQYYSDKYLYEAYDYKDDK